MHIAEPGRSRARAEYRNREGNESSESVCRVSGPAVGEFDLWRPRYTLPQLAASGDCLVSERRSMWSQWGIVLHLAVVAVAGYLLVVSHSWIARAGLAIL